LQASARRPGRPERPVDPDNSPQDALASTLRKLREDSGSPSYRVMAKRVPYSASTLARAASGDSLPHRDLALAYVRACGGNEDEWRSRWDAAAVASTPCTQDQAPPPDEGPAPGQAPPLDGPAPGGTPPLDDSPAPQSLHGARRPPRRSLAIAAAAGTVLAAGVATAVALPGQHHQPSGAARTTIAYRDGDDPAVTGCDQDVRTLEEAPVYLPSGQRFGTLLLRHSPSCAMSWGAVWGPDPHLYRVYITARRPADGLQAPSSWALNTPPGSYGNMLSTSRSCVMVEAHVHTPQGPGPVARTACLR
jgi:hypothetical protein